MRDSAAFTASAVFLLLLLFVPDQEYTMHSESRAQEGVDWGSLATYAPNRREPVYNWLYYKEGFSRQLVMKILDVFGAKGGHLVLDPFCGVGTTMLACRERGIDSIGFDVNPIAVFASRVKLRDYKRDELEREMRRITSTEFTKPRLKVNNILLKRGFPKKALEEIVFYRDLITQARNPDVRDFLILGLMNVAMRCSYIKKDGAVLKVRKRGRGSVPLPRRILKDQFRRMLKDLDRMGSRESRARADFGDARRLGLTDSLADFVITSPPYLNKREYEKAFRIEEELFLEPIRFGTQLSYIGSDLGRLERDSGRLAGMLDDHGIPSAASAYFMDMYQAIGEMHRVCRPGAKVAIVVGNGCFPSGVVESDEILTRIAEAVGFRSRSRLVLNTRHCTRNRTRKLGMARESLLVWEK